MPVSVSAVLLAAGYGTRLYPLTKDRPKALLPLGEDGRVVLDWIWAAVQTIPALAQAVLVSNRRFAGQFERWQEARRASVKVIDDGTVSPEARLGAIQDLLLALSRVGPEDDVLVLGTDNLFTWSLAGFAEFGRQRRPAFSVALRRAASLEQATRCGVVEQDRQGRVIRCVEKPAQPFSLTVSLCVYYIPVAHRAHLQEFLRGGGNGDAPGYFLEWLASRDAVYGFMTEGQWCDIGSLDAYQHLATHWQEFFKKGAGNA